MKQFSIIFALLLSINTSWAQELEAVITQNGDIIEISSIKNIELSKSPFISIEKIETLNNSIFYSNEITSLFYKSGNNLIQVDNYSDTQPGVGGGGGRVVEPYDFNNNEDFNYLNFPKLDQQSDTFSGSISNSFRIRDLIEAGRAFYLDTEVGDYFLQSRGGAGGGGG